MKAVEAGRIDKPTAAGAREAAYLMVALRAVTPAIFDILQVPVWGRRSDAADRLAAFMMLQFGEEFALNALKGSMIYLSQSDSGLWQSEKRNRHRVARMRTCVEFIFA